VYPADRVKAFIDAVVAIAMTLLILPLMESIGDTAAQEADAVAWVTDHGGQLVSFVLSFVIIAMFWIIHHRLFASVKQVNAALLWVCAAWLLSIVWLPVATALTGRMSDEDQLAKILYVGSMALTAILTLVLRWYLLSHPELHESTSVELRRGMMVDLSMRSSSARRSPWRSYCLKWGISRCSSCWAPVCFSDYWFECSALNE